MFLENVAILYNYLILSSGLWNKLLNLKIEKTVNELLTYLVDKIVYFGVNISM